MNDLCQILLAALALGVVIPALVALVWAGVTRCRKCGGWCVDEESCAERQRDNQR